jgi:hypothetical protein
VPQGGGGGGGNGYSDKLCPLLSIVNLVRFTNASSVDFDVSEDFVYEQTRPPRSQRSAYEEEPKAEENPTAIQKVTVEQLLNERETSRYWEQKAAGHLHISEII